MNSSIPYNESPLNILHIVNDKSLLAGGTGTVALEMSREQRNLGNHVDIWSIDSTKKNKQTISQNTLEGVPVTTFATLGPKGFGFSLMMEKYAVKRSANNYHLIHQHNIWLAVSRVTNRWRSTFQRPTVISPHGTLEAYALGRSKWKKRLALMAYAAKNLHGASCLHATHYSEAVSLRRFGLNNPIAIIPNGISDDLLCHKGNPNSFRNKYSIPASRRVLLFLSRIHPKKGLPLLFQALAQIPDVLSECLLVIVGPDEVGHRRELERVAERLEISDVVLFVGPLFGSDKQDAFAAADLFVLPTLSENFGIVVAEALCAGVPVVTTNGAPWEELQSYCCGWWVDISVDSIRDALFDAIRRPKSELTAMGQRGRALVEGKYTWPKVAEQSLQLYKWLLGQESRPDFVITD